MRQFQKPGMDWPAYLPDKDLEEITRTAILRLKQDLCDEIGDKAFDSIDLSDASYHIMQSLEAARDVGKCLKTPSP
ncbi:hypothetical protein FACS1894110_09970 [Spirochaetia bacterium]|nr:hypothetical protein FACS1894110_09970 [Spirochaetia bacterium]